VQVLINSLDLIGVLLIGVIGVISVQGIQSEGDSSKRSTFLRFFHLSALTFQSQVAILAIFAVSLLVLKTIFSVISQKRVFHFIAQQNAVISEKLYSDILRRSILFIEEQTPQKILYASTAGVTKITLGIVGVIPQLAGDFALLLFLTCALIAIDPLIALSSTFLFGITGYFFYYYIQKKAQSLGEKETKLNVDSNVILLEGIENYREIFVRNELRNVSEKFGKLRSELASVLAESALMPNTNKYVIETTVIIGSLILSGVQFILQDAPQAIASLSVFLVATTRMAPAAMRIQQTLIQIKTSGGAARETLDLLAELDDFNKSQKAYGKIVGEIADFTPTISIKDLSFRYPSAAENAVEKINLEITANQLVAIVGPSGAGKTTMVDIILGLIKPDSGYIRISSVEPHEAIYKWAGKIAYVPQRIYVFTGTLRENIVSQPTFSKDEDSRIWQALEVANLKEHFQANKITLDMLWTTGQKLSGGQLQRLGIARALVTSPELLILDEATSALDAQTESLISNSLNLLREKATVVIIAHRLSTVKNADMVIYMEKGKVIATGNFEEVRKKIPNFDKQAKLMGL
jgi:ATP-binding cassette subfamily C protein